MEESKLYLMDLPSEVLEYIFKQLNGKDLYKTRRVCKTWKVMIDKMLKRRKWKVLCENDFKKVFKHAKKNSPSLSWFNLYKSLTLWTRITTANMSMELFADVYLNDDFIGSFQIFDNKIGILDKNYPVCFDLESFTHLGNVCYNDIYTKYSENDKIVVLVNDYNSELFIGIKTDEIDVFNEDFLKKIGDNVTNFIHTSFDVYFITETGDISICKVAEDLQRYESKFLKQFHGNVIALSYTTHLNILTDKYDIYSLIGNDLNLQCTYTNANTLIQSLYEYNFLENIVWADLYKWFSLNDVTSDCVNIKWDISTVKTYGDVFFVGTKTGILSIYLYPYVNSLLDLTVQPVKEIKVAQLVKEEEDKIQKVWISGDALSEEISCEIKCIDIVEIKNGHTVILTLGGYVAELLFKHKNKNNNNKRKSNDIDSGIPKVRIKELWQRTFNF